MNFWDITLWERMYIDLWSVPHFLFGLIAFYLLQKAGMKKVSAFFITIFFAILWELLELLTPIQEYLTNILTDIIFAGLGFYFFALIEKTNIKNSKKIFKISFWLFIFFCVLGYLAAFIRNFF
ncbi:hypothetical protein GW764_03505 [Candidatus Parcubacteria bacterium]|nr:hypothetical protein [Candidatus Parcubacteria bacterium]